MKDWLRSSVRSMLADALGCDGGGGSGGRVEDLDIDWRGANGGGGGGGPFDVSQLVFFGGLENRSRVDENLSVP